jgi:hypothetical protein
MPAPMTAPIASMIKSPGPMTRFSPDSPSGTSAAIGFRWNSWDMAVDCTSGSRAIRDAGGRLTRISRESDAAVGQSMTDAAETAAPDIAAGMRGRRYAV